MRRSGVGRGLQSGPVGLVNLCSDEVRIRVDVEESLKSKWIGGCEDLLTSSFP